MSRLFRYLSCPAWGKSGWRFYAEDGFRGTVYPGLRSTRYAVFRPSRGLTRSLQKRMAGLDDEKSRNGKNTELSGTYKGLNHYDLALCLFWVYNKIYANKSAPSPHPRPMLCEKRRRYLVFTLSSPAGPIARHRMRLRIGRPACILQDASASGPAYPQNTADG